MRQASSRWPALLLMAVLAGPGAAAAQSLEVYIGPERCQTCHAYQHDVWRAGPHARAHRSLNDKQQTDRRCAQCHMMMTLTATGDQIQPQISCERCHGPGRYYAFDYVMRDQVLAALLGLVARPSEKSCLACHGEGTPNLRPFSYVERWPLIDHRQPAAAADATPSGPAPAPSPQR